MRSISVSRLAAATVLLFTFVSDAAGQPPAGVTFSYDLFLQGSSTPIAGGLSYVPGQNVTVDVYLRQTGGSSGYLASESGLFQGGVRMTFGNPSGTPGVISVASVNNIVLNTTSTAPPPTNAFNNVADSNNTRLITTDYAQFSPFTDGNYGVLPDANGRILLGTVTFTTNAAGGVTNLVLTDIPPASFTDNLTLNGTNLDPAISSRTYAVSPVPEPTVALTVGALAFSAAFTRRRNGSVRDQVASR